MAPPSKNFTVIPDADVDPDSPVTTNLMTALRDNDIHLEEWLGKDYTAAQNHDHDNVNSKAVSIPAASIGQGQLKTSSGTVSTSANTNLTLPGGEYGFYPRVRRTAGIGSVDFQIAYQVTWASLVTNIYIAAGGNTGQAYQRYITA